MLATYNFSLDFAVNTSTAVNFTVGGTATYLVDYTVNASSSPGYTFTETNGSVTIAPESTSASLVLDIIPDVLQETNETIILTVLPSTSNLVSATASSATFTIIDDDNLVGGGYN